MQVLLDLSGIFMENTDSSCILIINFVLSSATDLHTGTMVAIKKIHKPFSNFTLAKRTHRELVLLHYLRHENVKTLVDKHMILLFGFLL
jgi:hypothetical protein